MNCMNELLSSSGVGKWSDFVTTGKALLMSLETAKQTRRAKPLFYIQPPVRRYAKCLCVHQNIDIYKMNFVPDLAGR